MAIASFPTPPASSIAFSSAFIAQIITKVICQVNTKVIHKSDGIDAMETIAQRLKRLREAAGLSQAELARRAGFSSQGSIANIEGGTRGYGAKIIDIARELGTTPEYLRLEANGSATPPSSHRATTVPAPHEAPSPIAGEPPDLVITEYDTGGSMGHGYALEESPPGLIRAWRVTPEWLRMNVPMYSSLANLCIVTGFGPSMKPRYNPGDPLLCDRGFNKVDSDGVYFFRVDGHGFIKQLQRIPTENGLILRAKSFNQDYDPFDITSKMDFEVFGKILTVWRSEQF